MSQTGGCSCGCGGHGKRNEQDERSQAAAENASLRIVHDSLRVSEREGTAAAPPGKRSVS